MKKLTKSVTDKKLSGVCGGIASYLGIDSSLVRILVAFMAFAGCGAIVPLYIIAAFILPEEDNTYVEN